MTETPLCVDLDGTLVRTDLLFEGLIQVARDKPRSFLRLLGTLFSSGMNEKGRAELKAQLAEVYQPTPDLLPFNQEVLEYVREANESGRSTVLVTASHRSFAEKIASHLGVFDEVLATSNGTNLKGKAKAKALSERYESFEYIGDSKADIPVWESASTVSVVPHSAQFERDVKQRFKDVRIFGRDSFWKVLPRTLRVHQWVKNLLLFVPFVMAHKFTDLSVIIPTVLGFLAFCFTSSVVYIVNDLIDVENDRRHPSKSRRPFAAGRMLPQTGFVLIALLVGVVVSITSFLPIPYVMILAGYFVLTTGYSFYFKRIAVLDIGILASLYTVRIIAGGAAGDIYVTEWLLAFSMFMFLSLACLKRFSELLSLQERNEEQIAGRGYRACDLEQIAIFGSASGYLSVLVLALYISNPKVVELYSHPVNLWLLCPVVLYWITRVWLLARRGDVHEDPIVFALRDSVSHRVLAVAILVIFFAL